MSGKHEPRYKAVITILVLTTIIGFAASLYYSYSLSVSQHSLLAWKSFANNSTVFGSNSVHYEGLIETNFSGCIGYSRSASANYNITYSQFENATSLFNGYYNLTPTQRLALADNAVAKLTSINVIVTGSHDNYEYSGAPYLQYCAMPK